MSSTEYTPLLAAVPAEHKLMQTKLPSRIGVVAARKFVTAQLGTREREDFEDAISFSLVPGKSALVDTARLRVWVADRLSLLDKDAVDALRNRGADSAGSGAAGSAAGGSNSRRGSGHDRARPAEAAAVSTRKSSAQSASSGCWCCVGDSSNTALE